MSLTIEFRDPIEAARIVDALLTAAECVETGTPLLARRYRLIANDLGDALDTLPKPAAPTLAQAMSRRLLG